MNDRDRNHIAGLIRDRLTAIAGENDLGRDGQAVVQLDQQAVGRLSRMDAVQMQAMAKAQQARRDAEAARLRAALARIESGDEEYGYCDGCGEEIARARLHLNPAVATCIACARG
ncbi:TraR/DksA C4-type zinc finger protein [Pukyongiella litopenaei]|uniref:TraR/DksA family transcriptional regulator n=1 Tax=Pukyongiella litopenaei TaxID=2605946 RepID=A0A2S0MMI0_9RHOB|nr:TraR/DksA C4-type zinc finger protein [Pukyongiella litopenaei]AVO37095.1 TraR/DksA family transcriptional regulator [Pukyongiella litopenaei]